MKKILWKRSLALVFSFAILAIGFFATADTPLPTCTDANGKQVYCNPLGGVTDITELLKNLLGYLLKITLPLAGLGIIIAGLNYVFAAATGNPAKTQSAKKIFQYVLIGSFVVVGANAIAYAAINFLKELR